MNVLNPKLFEAMQRRLGRVRVSNDRFPASKSYFHVIVKGKRRLRVHVDYWGETYTANCPFCGDTRQRLCVCHLWGTIDPRTRNDHLNLAYCFNEECLSKRSAQMDLYQHLFQTTPRAGDLRVPSRALNTPPDATPPVVEMPEAIPLEELDERHQARQYLLHRGLDPVRLSRERQVGFLPYGFSCSPGFGDPRLIIPVHAPPLPSLLSDNNPDRIVGWQARTIDPRSEWPKYLSARGWKKGEHLYGLPLAIRTDGPVVIVEGVMDAWKVGERAVAAFGKAASARQIELLTHHFRGRPILVWLDPDAQEEAAQLVRVIRNARLSVGDNTPVLNLETPEGREDPGDCTPQEARQVVERALQQIASVAG